MTRRDTLRGYFKKGLLPTESNFAELIESMLIQDDDSISKPADNPLKITATGADEVLLNFYRQQGSGMPAWQLKQKAGDKLGLSIHDGADSATSRLFIENGTGNVGIGTVEPKAKLDVAGTIKGGGALAGIWAAQPTTSVPISGSLGVWQEFTDTYVEFPLERDAIVFCTYSINVQTQSTFVDLATILAVNEHPHDASRSVCSFPFHSPNDKSISCNLNGNLWFSTDSRIDVQLKVAVQWAMMSDYTVDWGTSGWRSLVVMVFYK